MNDGVFIGEHFPCIANEVSNKKSCSSSDGLAIYEHTEDNGEVWYDGFCWSCRQHFDKDTIHSHAPIAQELGIEPKTGVVEIKKHFKKKQNTKAKITQEERRALWRNTGGAETNSASNYRGISDETYRFYGFRIETNTDNSVSGVYFPETEEGELVGYKSRHHPKIFGKH